MSSSPFPDPSLVATLPPDGGPDFNRLAFSSSPYLLQHCRQPVDWMPWGDEAFERAKNEDKPVFLSVGYSTCHWCHVMAAESFDDPEVAEALNRDFISIKVDREERPDVDKVYMQVCLALTGQGGWPLTALLLPDRRAFFAGTYFPKHGRGGRPGMMQILPALARAWKEDRASLVESGEAIARELGRADRAEPSPFVLNLLDDAVSTAKERFDPVNGGFGGAPRFAVPHHLVFLLREKGRPEAEEMALATLRAIARGGIRDHVGGGFHRYATDPAWLLPHFEKMLSDQGLLLWAFAEALRVRPEAEFRDAIRSVVDYLRRDMLLPHGGLACAEDADSEGEEGKFYVWTRKELEELLGSDDAAWLETHFGVTAEGNFHEEASGRPTGANILHLPAKEETRTEKAEGRFAATWERIRSLLLEERSRRPRPLRDDKHLFEVNALAVVGLSRAALALGDPGILSFARSVLHALWERLVDGNGEPIKSERAGVKSGRACLEDWAYGAWAFLEFHQASLEEPWLERAEAWAKRGFEKHFDPETGRLLLVPEKSGEIPWRPFDVHDGATPSGAATLAWVFARLSAKDGSSALAERADGILAAFASEASAHPGQHAMALLAKLCLVTPAQEIHLRPAGGDAFAWLRAADAAVHDRRLFIETAIPSDEGTGAQICQDGACGLPVATPEALRNALAGPRPS